MARVHHVKKARKDYPDHGIKKGESYYWWKFNFGAKHYSKTPPKASQLTQSPFLGAVADMEEKLADIGRGGNGEDMADVLDELAGEANDLASECEDNRSNMSDSLQDSDTGQLLENRASSCEDFASQMEHAASEIRELWETFEKEHPDLKAGDYEAALEKALDECRSMVPDVSIED